MEKPFKFILPSPNFDKKAKEAVKARPHFLTPSGMTLLPREKQPPPMYGKMGATVPARFLQPVAQSEPIPEPVKQYCEPCELELASLEDFKRHRSQHEKCPVDGCQYRGHPSVMDKHVTVLHNSGLFDTFKKLSTPEELAAWREERRKRYPTVANVLLKQKAQEQRQKRGERLENNKSRFGRQDDRKRALPKTESKVDADNIESNRKSDEMAQGNRNKNKRKRRNNRDKKEDTTKLRTTIFKNTERTGEEEENPYPMFSGTLEMKGYAHINNKNKTPTNNALFGLVGMYGSDESEDCEDNELLDDIDIGGGVNLCDNSNDKSPIEKCNDLKIIHKAEDDSEEGKDNEKEDSPNQCIPGKDAGENINELTAQNHIGNPDEYSTITKGETLIHTTSPLTTIIKSSVEGETTASNNSPTTTTIKNNSTDEGPEETPIERSIPEYKIKPEKLPSNTTPFVNPEETRKHAKQPAEDTKARQIVKRKSGLDYRKSKVRKQNTLLEKLLESDIIHERNVLLQCVRYVCENKFFGVGQQSSNT